MVNQKILMKKGILFLLLMMSLNALICQDLTNIKKEKWSSFSGYLSGSTNYSTINSRTPFGYYVNVGLNWKIKGFNLPLNLSYGVNGFGANSLNIRRLGFSPGYKNFKIHVGYRSYQLNNYLLMGKTIIGGGIEWQPKKFGLLAFYGKFNDLYSAGNDYLLLDESIKIYDRWIIGGKLRFGTENNHFGLAGMKIYEDPLSGSFDSLKRIGIAPKENFGLNVDVKFKLFKIVNLEASVVSSIVTGNSEGEKIETSEANQKLIDRFEPLIAVNETSRIGFVYQGGISFPVSTMRIGVKYEAVDRNFNTLGASFFQSNYENISGNINGSIGRRISLGISAGRQNVHKTGFSGLPQSRFILNANASYQITDRFSVSGGYNNNQQNSNPVVEDIQDSLRVKINNQGWTASSSYSFGQKDKLHRLIFNVSSFQFEILNQDTIQTANTSSNYVVNYQYAPKNAWHIGGGINFQSTNVNFELPTQRIGINSNLSKNVKDGIRIKFDAGFKLNYTKGESDGFVINAGTNMTYPFFKKHKLTFGFQYFDRRTNILKARSGINLRLSYNYSF
jgi:hypothetical protein